MTRSFLEVESTIKSWLSVGFPGGSASKESSCNAGNLGSILESGTSPGGGNGYPLRTVAWEIPWIEEPGGLHPWGHKELDMTK